MNNLKNLLVCYLVLFAIQVQAQQKTNVKKQSTQSLDSAYLLHPFRDKVQAFKSNVKKEFKKAFTDFKDNNIFLYSGIGLSKQYINALITI